MAFLSLYEKLKSEKVKTCNEYSASSCSLTEISGNYTVKIRFEFLDGLVQSDSCHVVVAIFGREGVCGIRVMNSNFNGFIFFSLSIWSRVSHVSDIQKNLKDFQTEIFEINEEIILSFWWKA